MDPAIIAFLSCSNLNVALKRTAHYKPIVAPVRMNIKQADLGEIDILIQVAGLLRATRGEEISWDEWDIILTVNSKALFFMMQTVCNQSMIPQQSGAIINIASIAGLRGMKSPLCSAKCFTEYLDCGRKAHPAENIVRTERYRQCRVFSCQ